MKNLTRRQKKQLARILAGAALFLAGELSGLAGAWSLLFYLPAYLIVGGDVVRKAVQNICSGQVFDENFLMVLATFGAFALGFFSSGEYYPEAVGVMLFYQVGELFQSIAVGNSRRSIAALMDIRPDEANLEAEDGEIRQISPEEVPVGGVIVVKPGEKIPLDGTVLTGASSLNTAALTGEAAPRDVSEGDAVISGCINLTGLLRIRTTKPFAESTVAKILDLVENSSSKKARAENFITKFARWYTPAVTLCALALALGLPLLGGFSWMDGISRALIFLVVSCPCALVISIPLSFFGGIGGASRCGILVKGGNYLEALAKTGVVVFDKTGTLTKGSFAVAAVHPEPPFAKEELLELAALAESYSSHPISRSLREACGGALDPARVSEVEELSGHGVTAKVDGRTVAAGNEKLMRRLGVNAPPCEVPGTIVHLAVDGAYAGHIVIADALKADAAEAVRALKACGVRRTVMLTGDGEAVARQVAAQVGVDELHAGLLPADKVDRVEQLLAQKPAGTNLAFVGDGINDAPVLGRADIGIAMGALGSDAAIEAADVVLMDDAPGKIPLAIGIARKALRIVRENIVFALGVKALVLVLGALGRTNMWAAVFADVGVSVIAILNASRMLRVKQNS